MQSKAKKALFVFGTVILCIAAYNFLSSKYPDKVPALGSLGAGK
jgi:hypothetical protein